MGEGGTEKDILKTLRELKESEEITGTEYFEPVKDLRENFIGCLRSALEVHKPEGHATNFAMIVLEYLEDHPDVTLAEMFKEYPRVYPSLYEASLTITNPHLVKEKYGTGFSITINGREYRYVSDEIEPEEMMKKFMALMKKGGPGKALSWLKSHSVVYYGSKRAEKASTKSA